MVACWPIVFIKPLDVEVDIDGSHSNLMEAARNGDVTELETLLSKTGISANHQDGMTGRTILHEAVQVGSLSILISIYILV